LITTADQSWFLSFSRTPLPFSHAQFESPKIELLADWLIDWLGCKTINNQSINQSIITYILRLFLISEVSFLSITYWFYNFIFVWNIYAVLATFLSVLSCCRYVHVHTTYKEYLLRFQSINHICIA
jgi:hypothetical protein